MLMILLYCIYHFSFLPSFIEFILDLSNLSVFIIMLLHFPTVVMYSWLLHRALIMMYFCLKLDFDIWMCRWVSDVSYGGVGSDLQTWHWRRRRDVEMSPCSPSSSRTARLLWTRMRSGRRPLSHRPQSFCLEEEGRTRETEGSGHMTKLNQHEVYVTAQQPSNAEQEGGLLHFCILTFSWHWEDITHIPTSPT